LSNDVVGPDARIITKAAPPLRKAPRKAGLVVVGGVSLGFLLGLGFVFGRELASGVIHTQGQVKDIANAYCVVLPRTPLAAERVAPAGGAAKRLEEYVLDAPFSRAAEGFRNAIAILMAGRGPGRGNVVCVVSSVPKEGKTTVTTNLGALLAWKSKWRVLAIDSDLHRSSLTHKLAPDAKEGLIEALEAPSRLPSLVVKAERSGLDVLPCVTTNRLTNAAELLGSAGMEEVLERARDLYDMIIIEAPPIMSVADVKMLEHQVDQFVLVIEWGSTKRRLVREALDEVEGIRERLACVVLNKVDPAFLKNIETYKGSHFRDYYEG
jgi:succinoglycan biosynthesis transport protein ExoP